MTQGDVLCRKLRWFFPPSNLVCDLSLSLSLDCINMDFLWFWSCRLRLRLWSRRSSMNWWLQPMKKKKLQKLRCKAEHISFFYYILVSWSSSLLFHRHGYYNKGFSICFISLIVWLNLSLLLSWMVCCMNLWNIWYGDWRS